MAALLGKLVDRANADLVRMRAGRRPLVPDSNAVRNALDTLPADLFARDPEDEPIEPVRVGAAARVERWADRGSDWSATRARAATRQRAPAVVVLHGWLAVGLQMMALRALMRPLRGSGVELWYPWLPAHGPRTPAGSVSGVDCLSADMPRTALAIRRGVLETLELARWLRARGQPVAIVGVSLGGWIAALSATEAADFERVVLYTPVVDPARSFAESPLVDHIRSGLAASSVQPELTAELLARVAPMARPLQVPRSQVLLLGARHDNVVAPDSLRATAQSWGCDLEWLDAGHITAQWSPTGRRQARQWLAEVAARDVAVG